MNSCDDAIFGCVKLVAAVKLWLHQVIGDKYRIVLTYHQQMPTLIFQLVFCKNYVVKLLSLCGNG